VTQALRIFVASPGDVTAERDLVTVIAEEVQRTVGKLVSVQLATIRWETHAWPDIGEDAQDVINREITEFDVFVGIMWHRLGTRTKRAPSGTAEEFNRAYDYFRRYGRPKIMFYFRTEPFFTTDPKDARQFTKVLEFRRKLQKIGVLFWEYGEPLEFERRFREHLTNQVIELTGSRTVPPRAATPAESPKIFLSYKRQDLVRVESIYEALKAAGFQPWIDVRDILPGREWVREIDTAIRSADFFLTFVSRNSVDKHVRSETGFTVGSEINIAWEQAEEVARAAPDMTPSPWSYVIPVRLDPVIPPDELAQLQWIDVFVQEDVERLVQTVRGIWRDTAVRRPVVSLSGVREDLGQRLTDTG
jgi:TIR domain/Domain of unknown function (DUF4062)